MDRTTLGERLCNWHSSMHDPIYAVGSFYVSGKVHPDKSTVNCAVGALSSHIDDHKSMLAGRTVTVVRQGKAVDLKVFAGYTDEQLRENLVDLEEMYEALIQFEKEDYGDAG